VIPKPCSAPRFEWRGAMLDVARHFFGVDDVKRFVDLMARYKLNRLHLHLTDEQGWRIEIRSRPRLTEQDEHFTQQDYAEIVAHADRCGITVVPEIDTPGHVNAALVAYPELAPPDVVPEPYSGIDVGFSSLDVSKDETYVFVDDVVREVAAITPGPYLHIGGDEAAATKPDDYVRFMRRAQEIVRRHGKRAIVWEESARAELEPGTIVQHWKHGALARRAVEQGAKLIMSPSSRTYLDMKYDASTKLGLEWAGYVEVRDAYEWDPAKQVPGVSESDVLGVEAALWSETLETMADVELMAFPRLLALAEVAWSPQSERDWNDFSSRLAAHGATLSSLGVNFHRSRQIPWAHA
jgi:hexosaminidase